MKTHLIAIGNSRGVRIPKLLLEQAQFDDEVDMVLEEGQIVIRASDEPRKGWVAAFAGMAANGDDKLLDAAEGQSAWDDLEWEW